MYINNNFKFPNRFRIIIVTVIGLLIKYRINQSKTIDDGQVEGQSAITELPYRTRI